MLVDSFLLADLFDLVPFNRVSSTWRKPAKPDDFFELVFGFPRVSATGAAIGAVTDASGDDVFDADKVTGANEHSAHVNRLRDVFFGVGSMQCK